MNLHEPTSGNHFSSQEIGDMVPITKKNKRIDVFLRDPRDWFFPFFKNWYWILLSIVIFGSIFGFIRYQKAPLRYSSSCALIRQEVTDIRHSDLPAGYTAIQMNVIFNMVLSRQCLSDTIEQLNLGISPEALFRMVSVREASKRSNYFFINAVSREPELSANICNTLANAFINEYKRIIRNNISLSRENSLRSISQLKQEVQDLSKRRDSLFLSNGIALDSTDLQVLNRQITTNEERLITAQSEYWGAHEQKLTELKSKLTSLRQIYTDNNPLVISQKKLVEEEEGLMKKSVVFGGSSDLLVYARETDAFGEDNPVDKLLKNTDILPGELRGYAKNLVMLRARKEALTRVLPQTKMLDEQLEQKKQNILSQENYAKNLQIFLERSYSDIFINELAQIPKSALPRQIPLFCVIGAFLGLLLSLLIISLRILFRLQIRSKFDLTLALHIDFFGLIPRFSQNMRSQYYGAIHETIANMKSRFGNDAGKPVFVSLILPDSVPLDEQLQSEIIDVLKVKEEFEVKFILPTSPESTGMEPMVNDFLYGLSDSVSSNGDEDLYFDLNDLAFVAAPSEKRVAALMDQLNRYDVVIWKLFPQQEHTQLFNDICNASDLIVIPLKWNQTSKITVQNMIEKLDIKKIFALLYDLPAIKRGIL